MCVVGDVKRGRLCSLFILDAVSQPVKTFIETFTSGSTGRLHMPRVTCNLLHVQTVGHLLSAESVRQILFVGKHQNNGIVELGRFEHLPKLITCLLETSSVVAVDDENDGLRVQEIMPPKATNLR